MSRLFFSRGEKNRKNPVVTVAPPGPRVVVREITVVLVSFGKEQRLGEVEELVRLDDAYIHRAIRMHV